MVGRRTNCSPGAVWPSKALTAPQADEEVLPAPVFRAQQDRIGELERLRGRQTMEVEILKEALDFSADSKSDRYGRSVAHVAEGGR